MSYQTKDYLHGNWFNHLAFSVLQRHPKFSPIPISGSGTPTNNQKEDEECLVKNSFADGGQWVQENDNEDANYQSTATGNINNDQSVIVDIEPSQWDTPNETPRRTGRDSNSHHAIIIDENNDRGKEERDDWGRGEKWGRKKAEWLHREATARDMSAKSTHSVAQSLKRRIKSPEK